MSSRVEKRNEKQRPQKANTNPLRVIDISEWVLCGSVLLIILLLPWSFGSVQWKSQYLLAWVGAAVCLLTAFHCVLSIAFRSRDVRVPWLTWLFFLLGAFAFLQSRPVYSWLGNEIAPASVHMQRWALGLSEAPKSYQVTLFTTPKSGDLETAVPSTSVPCDLKEVPESDRKLAWSIEPLHTRGAAISLFLCGLFVWIGRMVFTDPVKQLWLFSVMTLIGILIACVGIQGAISYQSLNFLGLKTGGSFATYVSKNSAGGFFNICIAGCLGLLGWTLLNTQRSTKDTRYRFADKSLFSRIRGFAEDSLADLNTAQITAVFCLIGIVSALMISLCRGAAISALGAVIVAAYIANAKNRSRGSWIIFVTVATAFVACMIGFQVDDKAYLRLESLSEIDLEKELIAGRAYIWSMAWKAMSFYGWLGSGLGTFHYAYLPFQEPSSPVWFYHAESLYAQCGVELGYVGLAAMITAIILLIAELQRPAVKDKWGMAFPAKLAGAYLVVSQALHCFVDFAIILPSLFVPACVLIGSVQGTIRDSQISLSRKRSRSETVPSVQPLPAKSVSWLRAGLTGVGVSVGCIIVIVTLVDCVKSLSVSESMDDWTKIEEKKTLEEQSLNRVSSAPLFWQFFFPKRSPEDQSLTRVEKMAEIWASGQSSSTSIKALRENSVAMRSLADSLVFDYRIKQLLNEKPSGPWSEFWPNTSPAMLELVLQKEPNKMKRDNFILSIGGQEGMDLLKKAASSYALGHSKSPLDWRLSWGRCLTNMSCERDELARLLPASMALAKHSSQQLMAATILFRDQFDSNRFDQVLIQAMKTNPWSSANAAKLIKEERADKDISIEMFPQRSDILESIARQTFAKDLFPETNRLLWDRAQKLIEQAPMTAWQREIWLANSFVALDDISKEISHLRSAVNSEKTDINTRLRLANRLVDIMDFDEADKEIMELERRVPGSQEVKTVKDRIRSVKPK